MIDRIINKHLRTYEHTLPRMERIKRWHWNRVVNNSTPVLWCLSWVWWIPGLRWLWRLRCRNVAWRLDRRIRRLVIPHVFYDWGRQ